MNKYALLVLAGILLGGCASYTSTSGRVVIKDDTSVADVRINAHDRDLIENYYKKFYKNKKGLPSGLARRDKLPPGLQGDSLPYGLEKQLTKLPSSHVRIRVGQDIVLMDRNTRVVFDVIYGVGN
ncbi:MAG: hypothetical protein Tsb0026_16320 [Sulfuricaulis sp.]